MPPKTISHTVHAVINPDGRDMPPELHMDIIRAQLVQQLIEEIGKQMFFDLSVLIDKDGLCHASVTWIDEIEPPKEET